MFPLSDLSGNKLFFWFSPKLSLLASLRDWQRSVFKHVNTHMNTQVWKVRLSSPFFFLSQISTLQGLKADTGALMCLCEKTDNDIRSCINTLQVPGNFLKKPLICRSYIALHHIIFSIWLLSGQFLHGRGLKQLDSRIIQSISVGQKDQNKGLFCLWQEIFQLPRTKR